MFRRIFLTVSLVCAVAPGFAQSPSASTNVSALSVATFDVDVTPPIGSMMAYDHVTNLWDLGLRARGIVLLGAGEPIVLCAVDWIGIANRSYDVFRETLARAAGTTTHRVAVHALHQHDAPDSDFSAEEILKAAGLETRQFESKFQRQALTNIASALTRSLADAKPITHVGLGEAAVKEVASNRRIMGADGKVRDVRWTAMPDPKLRAEPEGLIDPMVSLVSFWNGEQPVAILSYYATHPQSYYRTGIPNPDFPGIARFLRQMAVPAALHVHFNGAGGNIGAGKYNDGSPTNRLILAERLADGMKRAWDSTKRQPLATKDVQWSTALVALPPGKHLEIAQLEAQFKNPGKDFSAFGEASRLAWLRRCRDGYQIEVSSLGLGSARIVHLPGELFVEYQLAAKAMRPDSFVAVAAYGDYAPWYIGTAAAYAEGGYETEPRATNVGPDAEKPLMAAIRKLLRPTE
jgi:hypothetical protein